ncbi:MAG: family phosphatase [Sphingomonadales bacterium]|nr:family phosphatase [Sphingomonadales bacterium]
MSAETQVALLISDVDGTLVRSDKTLADATIAAVHRLKDADLPMTLISARPPSGMIWIAEKLDLDGPFGAFNGGVLFRRDGTVIERHCLEGELAKAVVALIVEAGITCWVFADDQWLSNNADDPHNQREVESANVQPVITDDFGDKLARADKIVGVSDDHELLVRLEASAVAIAGGNATIARSQPYYLDITALVANKGDGIAFLAKSFGVSLEDVAVIGDQTNDLPMFARAGLSIAMGQASDAVKARAMLATDGNDDDGVAKAIDRDILPRVADRS